MRTILRWVEYLWREYWPVIFFLSLAGGHLLLIYYLGLNASNTNKAITFITQLVGVVLILYSIDANIKVIKETSLLSMFVQSLKDWPLITRSVTTELQGSQIATAEGEVRGISGCNPRSIEEKIEYLQEQISDLKLSFEQKSQEVNKKIDDQSKELSDKDQEINAAIRINELTMDKVFVGGTKTQIFGVLIMIYGYILGYFSDSTINTYSYVGCSLHDFTNITSSLIKLHCA